MWSVGVESSLCGLLEWSHLCVVCWSGVVSVWSIGVELSLCGLLEWSRFCVVCWSGVVSVSENLKCFVKSCFFSI